MDDVIRYASEYGFVAAFVVQMIIDINITGGIMLNLIVENFGLFFALSLWSVVGILNLAYLRADGVLDEVEDVQLLFLVIVSGPLYWCLLVFGLVVDFILNKLD